VLGDDQLGVAQATAHVDDLADVLLPGVGRQVSAEGAVDLGEQPRELVEFAGAGVAYPHARRQ
jgi:hypothetical protein